MTKENQVQGKCFCGKYRYTITGTPHRVVHCHCGNCRRSVGAAYVTWVVIKRSQYTINDKPRVHTATNRSIRSFCEKCGSSLTYSHPNRPEFMDVTAGTVNHPDKLSPDWHILGKRKVEWVKLHDNLPFYENYPD